MHIIMFELKKLFKFANWGMVTTAVAFTILVLMSYGWESHFSIILLAIMHVSQIFLAGFFKVFYVLRLIALKEMGLPTH